MNGNRSFWVIFLEKSRSTLITKVLQIEIGVCGSNPNGFSGYEGSIPACTKYNGTQTRDVEWSGFLCCVVFWSKGSNPVRFYKLRLINYKVLEEVVVQFHDGLK